ncbi:hypothetical protein C5167_041730 [Papaver somniferum]|nr:hypothetical protein C5167_041730 [Papaver somniferum]
MLTSSQKHGVPNWNPTLQPAADSRKNKDYGLVPCKPYHVKSFIKDICVHYSEVENAGVRNYLINCSLNQTCLVNQSASLLRTCSQVSPKQWPLQNSENEFYQSVDRT